MFILGVVSFLQITFIPGYIAIRFLRLDGISLIQRAVYIFTLSLLINYIVVMPLASLNIYYSWLVFLLLAIEFIVIGGISFKDWKSGKNSGYYVRLVAGVSCENTLSGFGIILISIISLLLFCYLLYKNLGTIFLQSDMMGSYNPWTLEFLLNRLPDPANTMSYPILMPANWSLGYLIMQNENIQFFNKMTLSLFPFVVSLLFIDLSIKNKSLIYLLGLVFYSIILILYTGYLFGAGTLDIPAASIGFLAFYAILDVYFTRSSNKIDGKRLILVILFASVSALIKQAGLFLLIVIMAWLVWFLFVDGKNKTNYKFKENFIILLLSMVVVSVLVLSWYGYIEYQIFQGRSSSSSAWLTKGIHEGRDNYQRFLWAMNLIFPMAKSWKIIGAIIFLLSTLGVFHEKSRLVFLLIICPYLFIWVFYYSYEIRTISPIMPFVAYSAAFGVYVLFEKCFFRVFNIKELSQSAQKSDLSNRVNSDENCQKIRDFWDIEYSSLYLKQINPFVGCCAFSYQFANPMRLLLKVNVHPGLALGMFISVLFAIIILNFTWFSSDKLLLRQSNLLMTVGEAPQLNEFLVDYVSRHEIKGKIASQYGLIRIFPQTKQYYFPLKLLGTYDYFNSILERDDITHIIIKVGNAYGYEFDGDIIALIMRRIENKEYTLLLRDDQHYFIKIR
ncbi:hypothetical protein [Methylomonas rivi]|uniref:Glycosyltransferase RgtA/B/C/D-like domain-containing protein n=1 Tax=Methylomonas rivi TaxID=2952226 RepID=A0ABT1U247_9GAMM|nr:hypothetical protein [Methylomonas sp. WSC-6]MCQ8127903.1 hypothetical protein [Methylomonas sp. WSC-6]